MNIIIWILQIVLACIFLLAGSMKTFLSKDKLKEKFPMSEQFSIGMIRFIGISELLGGIGVIVPWLTGINPILTPVAASALAFVMILAGLFHLQQKEYKGIPMNAGLLIISVMVAWFRF